MPDGNPSQPASGHRLLFRKILPAAMALFVCGLSCAPDLAQTLTGHTTWREYGGAADGAQYSALHQVDRSNVSRLQVAWTYKTEMPGSTRSTR